MNLDGLIATDLPVHDTEHETAWRRTVVQNEPTRPITVGAAR